MATIDKTRIAKPSPIVEDDQGQLRARKGISREVVRGDVEDQGRARLDARAPAEVVRDLRAQADPHLGRRPVGPELRRPRALLAAHRRALQQLGRRPGGDEADLRGPRASRRPSASTSPAWSACGTTSRSTRASRRSTRSSGSSSARWTPRSTRYPELVEQYFMTKCVPAQDNKFSALHGAIWSGGSFLYVPAGVKVDLPLQAYFRMEGQGEGTFEHTLIIAEDGAEVNYIEGCTAQTYRVNSMHSAVVEIFVKEGGQGPLHDGPELVQGRLQPQHQARGRRGRGHGGVGRRLDGRQVRDALPGLVPARRGRARRPPQRRRRRRGRAQGHRRQGRPPRAQHDLQHPGQVDLQGRRDHGLPRPGAHGPQLRRAPRPACSATA